MTIDLEAKLDETFGELGIPRDRREKLEYHLQRLQEKHVGTYHHSIRVALTGVEIAKYKGFDALAFFYAGLLHDIGKLLVPTELLEKTVGFSADDMNVMKKHPVYGYFILKERHPFSAEIALRHHRFKKNDPYPEVLPDESVLDEKTVEKVNFYARLLSVIDFYDAIKNRANDKYGNGTLSSEEIKQRMLAENPAMSVWIEDFYAAKIFM